MRTVEAAGLSIGDGHPPRIMGVLNVSSESPYDPSVYADPAAAAAHADAMIEEGADVVDVGLESANKRFDVLSAEQELDRLDTAVAAIDGTDGDAVFSIETRYAEVAAEALDRGFDMVNDVCGFADPKMAERCVERDVAVVKMASPPDLDAPGAVQEYDWASAGQRVDSGTGSAIVDDLCSALERGGLTEKTIVDPAFGGWSEAKTTAQDRETFEHLQVFRRFEAPILVSINRKNFLGEPVGRETDERLPASLAATALAVERGADLIRTHDVSATHDAARIGHELGDRDRFAATDSPAAEAEPSTD
jgi:dihydropteroate synthase